MKKLVFKIVTNIVNKINGNQAVVTFFRVSSCFSSSIFCSIDKIFFGLQNLKNRTNESKLIIAETTSTNSGPTKFKKINCVIAKEPPETKIAGRVSFIPLNPSTINTNKKVTISVTKHKIIEVAFPSDTASSSVRLAGIVTGIPIAP